MFADLDPVFLKNCRGFDDKTFSKNFVKLIQCRKIAGLYMLPVITPISVIHIGIAAFVGVLYIACYLVYRDIYMNNTSYTFEWSNDMHTIPTLPTDPCRKHNIDLQSTQIIPQPLDQNFNMNNAYVQGTYEACVTGNAFVINKHN